MSCSACEPWLQPPGSGGDRFPAEVFEIAESYEYPIGTHGGSTGRSGWGRCLRCGQPVRFDCGFPAGYTFRVRPPPLADPRRASRRGDLSRIRAEILAREAAAPSRTVVIRCDHVSLDPARVANELASIVEGHDGDALDSTPVTDGIAVHESPYPDAAYFGARGAVLWVTHQWYGGTREAVRTDVRLRTSAGDLVSTSVVDSCTTTRIELAIRANDDERARVLAMGAAMALRTLGEPDW